MTDTTICLIEILYNVFSSSTAAIHEDDVMIYALHLAWDSYKSSIGILCVSFTTNSKPKPMPTQANLLC